MNAKVKFENFDQTQSKPQTRALDFLEAAQCRLDGLAGALLLTVYDYEQCDLPEESAGALLSFCKKLADLALKNIDSAIELTPLNLHKIYDTIQGISVAIERASEFNINKGYTCQLIHGLIFAVENICDQEIKEAVLFHLSNQKTA